MVWVPGQGSKVIRGPRFNRHWPNLKVQIKGKKKKTGWTVAWGGEGQCSITGTTRLKVETGADKLGEASQSLKEVLELPDDLRVHALHEGGEALVAHQRLLGLELLVDKLLQGDAVHRVFQGQLQGDRQRRHLHAQISTSSGKGAGG